VRGAEFARQQFQPQCILLDDGFQHRRLARDWDIVVVNSQTGFGNGRLLPAGPLREPLRSLERAHLLWLNHVTDAAVTPGLLTQIKAFGVKPLIHADFTPKHLIALPTGVAASLELLQRGRILAFSGIANPERFHRTLQTLTQTEMVTLRFPDHHRFTTADLERIQRQAMALKAGLVITTEKDAVRLPATFGHALSLFYLEMELTVRSGSQFLDQIAVQIRNAIY
jgi:tetraacyldisaccharide 4'-kinase